MKTLLVALFVIVATGSALALPPAVELDRLMLHAKKALEAKSYQSAADQLTKAKKLGIALPESFSLRYATALAGLGRTKEARSVVDTYFNKYGTKGASYKEVLELLVRMEDQVHAPATTPVKPAPATEAGTSREGTCKDLPTMSGTEKTNQVAAIRPQIPLTVSEDIWRAIETSDAYRNAPRPQAYRISYQTSSQIAYTGSKSSSLPTPAAISKIAVIEQTPLGDKCLLQRSRDSYNGKTSVTESYVCGFIGLGSTLDGTTSGYIKSLDELQGSLFPLRIGNRMSLRYQHAYVPDRRFDATISSSCQVVSTVAARDLHPSLKGNAWKIHCLGSYTSNYDNKAKVSESDDYYLEDLGLKLSEAGQYNVLEKKFFWPQPGDQTVIVAEGEYGSRNTTTYISYDWSVGAKIRERTKLNRPQRP